MLGTLTPVANEFEVVLRMMVAAAAAAMVSDVLAPSRLCLANELSGKQEYNFDVRRSSVTPCGDPVVLTGR